MEKTTRMFWIMFCLSASTFLYAQVNPLAGLNTGSLKKEAKKQSIPNGFSGKGIASGFAIFYIFHQ